MADGQAYFLTCFRRIQKLELSLYPAFTKTNGQEVDCGLYALQYPGLARLGFLASTGYRLQATHGLERLSNLSGLHDEHKMEDTQQPIKTEPRSKKHRRYQHKTSTRLDPTSLCHC
jgi:hypothetical protein